MEKEPVPAAAGHIAALLRAAGCVYAEEEAALLAAQAADSAALGRMLAQRIAGRPLEHVLGWAAFCGLRLQVGAGVFIPRRRTELLAELAAEEAAAVPGAVVVDLCCGTGAVGAVVADRSAFRDTLELVAVDVDPAAVACARRNLPERAMVAQGDLFGALPAKLRGRVNLLAANAPYVPTDRLATLPSEARLHEPPRTYDGGADGLAVLVRIAAGAPPWLAPAGVLMVECAAGQVEALSAAFGEAGLAPAVRRRRSADATVLLGRTPGTNRPASPAGSRR